jgi:hypothetical protein
MFYMIKNTRNPTAKLRACARHMHRLLGADERESASIEADSELAEVEKVGSLVTGAGIVGSAVGDRSGVVGSFVGSAGADVGWFVMGLGVESASVEEQLAKLLPATVSK